LIIGGAMTEIDFHGDDAAPLQVGAPLRFIKGGSPTHFCENEP